MPILGTFLKDGDSFTGVIVTPTTQARLTFTPDGSGILIARIGGKRVGYARPHGTACFAVYLHPDVMPHARLAALVRNGCIYTLRTCR